MPEQSPGCWVGFDLGGTKMLSTVFDAGFQELGRSRKKTKGKQGVEAGLERIVETIGKSLEEAKIGPDQISGIGIGCPGPVDLERGVVCEAPNLGWEDVPVRDVLEKAFGCPAVVVNDVDAGVYGEYRFGAAREARCALGVFPGTGIGGGCVYEGKIIRGMHRSCMEIGHVPVMPLGPLSGSPRRGCAERIASRLAIAAAVAQAAYRGEAPNVVKLAGTDLSDIRSGVLAKAIEAGDTVVERIIREAAEVIGIAVAGAVLLLSPDVVVLGGGLVEAMPELFLSGVSKSAKENVLESFADSFRVVPAELSDDATVMGAAAWAQEAINSHPHPLEVSSGSPPR